MKLSSFYKHVCFLILLSSFTIYLHAEEVFPNNLHIKENKQVADYLRFIRAFEENLGPFGDYSKGEIQIILDPEEIAQIEENHRLKLLRRGVDEKSAFKWSRVGIIDSDSIWIWIRDAVILPSGRKTIRDRMTWKTAVDGPQGVSTLPVLKDKRMILCLKYKHATRSWQIELPRGVRLFGETAEKASNRQLRKDTGFTASNQLYLGSVAPDSSNFNTLTPVFLGYLDEQEEPTVQSGEDVLGLLILTKSEIKDAFLKGHLELKIHDKVKKVAVNDSYLAFAILQAEIRGLI